MGYNEGEHKYDTIPALILFSALKIADVYVTCSRTLFICIGFCFNGFGNPAGNLGVILLRSIGGTVLSWLTRRRVILFYNNCLY